FDDAFATSATLGFRLRAPAGESAPLLEGYDHPVGYAQSLYACLTQAQAIDVLHSPTDVARTVMIDDCGFSPVAFHLTAQDYDRLVACGRTAATAFLDEHTTATATTSCA